MKQTFRESLLRPGIPMPVRRGISVLLAGILALSSVQVAVAADESPAPEPAATSAQSQPVESSAPEPTKSATPAASESAEA